MYHGVYTLIFSKQKEVCIDGPLKTFREFIPQRRWPQMRLEELKCMCSKMPDTGYV